MRSDVVVAIDDDSDQVALLSTILSQSGYAVVTALDGASGIQAVQEHRPLLVTVDLDMPGIDGVETTRRIREFSDCFVLIVTSRQNEVDLISGLGAGADGYVSKPLSPRAFRARVGACVVRAACSPAHQNSPSALSTDHDCQDMPPSATSEISAIIEFWPCSAQSWIIRAK